MVDFNAARSELSISKGQFQELDKLDGNKNGDISSDIFSQAKSYREQQSTYSPINGNIDSEIKEILDRGITRWNEPKPGTGAVKASFVSTDERDIHVKQEAAKARHGYKEKYGSVPFTYEFVDKLAFAATEITEYYLEHGNLNGKKLKNLPDGVEIITQNFEYEYLDNQYGRRNDEEEYMNDTPVYNRNPDEIKISLKFYYNGEHYTFDMSIPITINKPKMGV